MRKGDVVKVREGSKTKKIFENLALRLKDYNFPTWINFDVEKMEGHVLEKDELVGLYSREKI